MTDNEIKEAFAELIQRKQTNIKLSAAELALLETVSNLILKIESNLRFVRGTVERQKAEIKMLQGKIEGIARQTKIGACESIKADMQESKYRINDSAYAKGCNDVLDFWIKTLDGFIEELTEGS